MPWLLCKRPRHPGGFPEGLETLNMWQGFRMYAVCVTGYARGYLSLCLACTVLSVHNWELRQAPCQPAPLTKDCDKWCSLSPCPVPVLLMVCNPFVVSRVL